MQFKTICSTVDSSGYKKTVEWKEGQTKSPLSIQSKLTLIYFFQEFYFNSFPREWRNCTFEWLS